MSIESWNERYRAGERGNRKPAAIVIEAADGLPAGRALDLACGAGRNAIFLARNGWQVLAVDGSVGAIALTRARSRTLSLPVEVLVQDLERLPLPFADASFDLICIILYSQLSLIAEALRILKGGGRLVVEVRTKGSFALEPESVMAALRGCRVVSSRMRSDTLAVIAETQLPQ